MPPVDIVIIGAGGHGRDCHQLLDDLRADGGEVPNLLGYLDDSPALAGQEVQGLPVLGGLTWLSGRRVGAVLGVGHPKSRQSVQRRAAEVGVREWPRLIHPRACVTSRAVLGEGVYVGALTFIGPNARLGDWAVLNVGASVGHDVQVGPYTLIGPHCSVGTSQIGEGAFLGQMVVVTPGSRVGAWATVGANSTVLPKYPISDGQKVFGQPAHPRAE